MSRRSYPKSRDHLRITGEPGARPVGLFFRRVGIVGVGCPFGIVFWLAAGVWVAPVAAGYFDVVEYLFGDFVAC